MTVGLINAALRVTGLGSRFLLAIFMARFMTLEDVGTFALMAGAAGLLPPVAGLGLNFFMARQLVGIGHDDAVRLVGARLAISVAAGACCMGILLGLEGAGLVALPIPLWLAVAILMLELLGLDVQVALVARSRSNFANMLLFLRNGAWVLPFMVAAFVDTGFRSIEVLAWFWLAGLAASHLLLFLTNRLDAVAMLQKHGLGSRSFLSSVGAGTAKIYLSDLGLAGSVYLDRFIISAMLDVRAAGVFFFFASIINSAYVICQAATIQVFQPQLRAAWLAGGFGGLQLALRDRFRTTVVVGLGGLLAAGPATWIAAHISGQKEILAGLDIVPLLLAAYAFKLLSDFMNLAFAAAERDGHYAAFNIAGLALGVTGCLVAIPHLGIMGAAFAMLLASASLFAGRFIAWKRLQSHAPAAREAA